MAFFLLFVNREPTSAIQLTPDLVFSLGLNATNGVAVDEVNRVLYVADSGNNRVLLYRNIDSLTPTPIPNAIFGQLGPTGLFPNQGGFPTATSLWRLKGFGSTKRERFG